MQENAIADFWERVKKLAKMHNISQKKLSVELGCHPRQIERCISRNSDPTATFAYAIAEYFTVSVEWLFTGRDVMRDYSEASEVLDRKLEAVRNDISSLNDRIERTISDIMVICGRFDRARDDIAELYKRFEKGRNDMTSLDDDFDKLTKFLGRDTA